MDDPFLIALAEFYKENFNYDPENPDYPDTIFNPNPDKLGIDSLKLSTEEISSLLNYQTLSLLLKTDKDFRDSNKNLVLDILRAIYTFYAGNKNASDYLSIQNILPMNKNFEGILNCFNKAEDLEAFLIFNFTLVNLRKIDENFYNNKNFLILESLLLYDYVYIHDYIKNKKIKYAIGKIIKSLMNIYNKSSQENEIAICLKKFFFENGKISNKSFLIPENPSENGYKEFDSLIMKFQEKLKEESLAQIINGLTKLKKIKLCIEEESEETEISSEGNINEEPNNDVNMNMMWKKLQDQFNLMKKENSENMQKLIKQQKSEINKYVQDIENLKLKTQDIENLKIENRIKAQEIEKLKLSDQEQNKIIEAQSASIENLNNIILEKNTTIEKKENKIKELNQDISLNKKNLKKSEISLLEKDIEIDNLKKLSSKNSQLITRLTTEVSTLNKKVASIEYKLKSLQNTVNLIGCRDFLRKVFNDFCYLFSIYHSGKYKETADLINSIIKNEDKDSHIKVFAQKVNLIEFIKYLGTVIDESDDISHYFFKELSIYYRDDDITQITDENKIKENIIKCKNFFNEYSRMNFDTIFSFFMNECDYPNCILKKQNISEKGLLNCIKQFNNKDNH